MSSLERVTNVLTSTFQDFWLADNVTETSTQVVTSTRTSSWTRSYPTKHINVQEVVKVFISVQMPLTCENIHSLLDHPPGSGSDNFVVSVGGPVSPNPDIAGIGVCTPHLDQQKVAVLTWHKILFAFFVTAGSVVLLALLAYMGGFLPNHFLRPVDRQVFRANSRNAHSRWRKIFENVMMSLSDQQLVTGLAILVAGYYEMMNSYLDSYHWEIVVYLAWMSSSVHIASLTVLRDVFNRNPTLRNLRVAGMLILLALLSVATWPTRLNSSVSFMPAKCLWSSFFAPRSTRSRIDPNWVLTMVMLIFAYVWKLSQLFASSRGWVRTWIVAKPEAALERLMRRAVKSHRSIWLRWPAYKIATICYMIFIAYAGVAESFAASIIYLCITFPYGVVIIVRVRSSMDDEFIASEQRLTFGQLVPLFLLIIPVLLVFELSVGM